MCSLGPIRGTKVYFLLEVSQSKNWERSWGWARVIRRVIFFQAEDEALLSEEDDPIDRRPWTQQHLEAADIRRTPSLALTPPQAEQEVDVLDVNVRGPGQCLRAFSLHCAVPAPWFHLIPVFAPLNDRGDQTGNQLEECLRKTGLQKL